MSLNAVSNSKLATVVSSDLLCNIFESPLLKSVNAALPTQPPLLVGITFDKKII
jgi:hypothetical protein